MVYQILRELAAGVAANAAVNAWCQEHYSDDIHVILGIDQKRPPSPQDVPFVAFSASESTDKGLLTQGTLLFDVLWGVTDEGKTTDGNLTEYTGVRLCDELGALVSAALERVEKGYTVASGSYSIELSTPWFPLWCGLLSMTANIRR
jgi:hypothetical protein